MTDSRPDIPQCPHVFDHPVTYADRQLVNDAIAYSRSIGDLTGLQIHLARLGPCHAREQYLALLADAEEAAHADNITRDHHTGT
ncbi:hypothetical protein LO772_08335 [Yinghuangia sp. ASG 101]|uniref:hypothetical protein n=1 Tax=Yinghuangia sp. ASG 101 TaxID=2896848 RepID=UPI001E36405F|nr:hypothetical protein [Yinghuangia sp. ASG 101]UGQ15713.1 hypothetical protein LO772_08335 [Yinghuangia sp. ASG 101]